MVTQQRWRLIIMKKSVHKSNRKDKTTSTAITMATTEAADVSQLTSRKTVGIRAAVGPGTGRCSRPGPGRRKPPRHSQSDRRVRDYLLGLPDPSEHESKPEHTHRETPDTSNDRLTSDTSTTYRDRRNSDTSRVPPVTRDLSVLTFGYNPPPPINVEDLPYDPFKASSSHLDIIERVRDQSDTDRLLDEGTSVTGDRQRDIQFIRDINRVQQRINTVDVEPFFAKWKITGFKRDQVLIESTVAMTSEPEKKVSPEFVQYVKERDAARAEVKTALEELRDTQCRLYDAIQEIERLEKKSKGSNKKPNPPKKKAPAPAQNLKVPSGATGSSSGVSSARTSTVNSVRTGTDGVYHPPIDGIEPDIDTCEYYWKIGEMFPTLPMFYILDAEKKFIKADLDYSGSIDSDELGKVLEDAGELLFTPSQVEGIFKEVDTNNSNYVDFYEVLVVLNKLYSRRKTNLPLSLQQNYSRTCTIQ